MLSAIFSFNKGLSYRPPESVISVSVKVLKYRNYAAKYTFYMLCDQWNSTWDKLDHASLHLSIRIKHLINCPISLISKSRKNLSQAKSSIDYKFDSPESIFDGNLWTIQLRRFGVLQYMQAFKLFLKIYRSEIANTVYSIPYGLYDIDNTMKIACD